MIRRPKKMAASQRLLLSPNADAVMRAMVAASDPVSLRRLAADPAGRQELQRLQRVAAARADEFRTRLELARTLEATFTDALRMEAIR